MAYLILLRNPLTPHEKEEHELAPGETPIEWLQKHHPDGFGMPIRYYVNADEMPLDDLDRMPDVDDIVIIALMPGGFIAAMPLLAKLVIGLAIMAASYFAMMLFAPKQPKKQKSVEPIEQYTISSDQNAARYGDPIPVVYGEVLMAPDYAAQPYTWFQFNDQTVNEALNGIQYLDLIMCVGQGAVEVSQVKVGSTDVSMIPELVTWRTFQPWEHNSTFGSIQANMPGWFYENVVTCPEVDNQEFVELHDTAGWFTVCKAGTKGSTISVDIVFPNGLYYVTDNQNQKGTSVSYNIYWREVDDAGNWAGPEYGQQFMTSTRTQDLSDTKNSAEISAPVRRTHFIPTAKSGRWAVKLIRMSGSLKPAEGQFTFVWAGLKLIADAPSTKAYGDVTLLAARIKASRGVGNEAAVRVTARCKRWLNGLPNGEWQHTKSPADAFYDIYTNTIYGPGRPVSELDLTELINARNKWAGYEFNHVFRDRTTVWEALKTSVLGQAAEPLPLGSVMSIASDGVKQVRSMLFTDANIVENSMKVNYIFDIEEDSDGIEVQYIDPLDWNESFVRYPANAVIPQTVTLAGCTNTTQAAQYARLVWQRTRSQRKRITFETELEGIILQLGDRIGISHTLPRWGDNGLVIAINGLDVTVDHDLNWSGGAKFMMFRTVDGVPSNMFTVTQGAQPNIARLSSPLNFEAHVDDDYDYTSFVFGDASKMVRDFIVASTKHSGDTTVTIEAVNSAPEIFDGTMPFLGGNP